MERRGYLRLAARGHMTDEEPSVALQELDETRGSAGRELRTARARGESLERLQHDRAALLGSYAGMVQEALDDLETQERHRVYKLLRLSVHARPGSPLEISGVFAEVDEEGEGDLSYCKRSSLGV